MKRITYYQARTKNEKGKRFPENVFFLESKGTLAEITSKDGLKIHLVLEYDRSLKAYFATELTSGLGSKPCVHKDKDVLLSKLAELEWKRIMTTPQTVTLQNLLKEKLGK